MENDDVMDGLEMGQAREFYRKYRESKRRLGEEGYSQRS